MLIRRTSKAVLLSAVAVVLIATPILAFLYQAPFTIIEDAGTDYAMFPASVDASNTFMAANGFMEADALDTRVETLAGSDKPHMVASDRTLGAVPVEANSQTNLFFTTGETDLAEMNIITGFDGFVTIIDVPALEPGNDFEFEFTDTWIDTTGGTDKALVAKGGAFTIVISATGSITAGIGGSTDTFTPDADVEVDSVDGFVTRRVDAGEDWGVMQGAVIGTAVDSAGAVIEARFQCDANLDKFDRIMRAFLLFDTSPIPDSAIVVSATLRVFGTAKLDQKPWGDLTLNAFSSDPATDTNLITADYDEVGSTPFSDTAIAFAGYDIAGWNTLTLNAAGVAAISVTDITKLSMREATYEGPDIEPAYNANSEASFKFQSADGANAPELAVTFLDLTVTAINQATGEHDVLVTADTVNFDISIDGAVGGDGFDTVALGGGSVADNATDWTILDNSTTLTTPYAGAYQQTVGGVLIAWYQPITIVETVVGKGVLVDRQGGDEDGSITWGTNPAGITVTLGSMVAASQPIIGATEDVPTRDILPPITVSDWFGDGTVSGSTLTNPIRPLITAMSDNTTLTEIQVWRLMGVIAILFATVATAFTIRQHQGITAIVAGVMLGGLVAFDSNIFPMWTLVIATGLFIAGVVAERSPSL